MDTEVVAAIITAGPVVLVAVATIVVNRVYDDRRDKRHQAELTAQRADTAAARSEDYMHQRTERSYSDRRDAIAALLSEVNKVTTHAAELEAKHTALKTTARQVASRTGSTWTSTPLA